MSRDLIDPESRVPLDGLLQVLPGGFNAIWDRDGNRQAWDWYLGGAEADQYAAPARAQDVSGLPPTFIDVGTVDLFRDEDIAFGQRLMQAGVPTELHTSVGSYHASEALAPDAPLSQRIWALRVEALRRALT